MTYSKLTHEQVASTMPGNLPKRNRERAVDRLAADMNLVHPDDAANDMTLDAIDAALDGAKAKVALSQGTLEYWEGQRRKHIARKTAEDVQRAVAGLCGRKFDPFHIR